MKKRNTIFQQKILPSFGVIPNAKLSIEDAINIMAEAKLKVINAIDDRMDSVRAKELTLVKLTEEIADLQTEANELRKLVGKGV